MRRKKTLSLRERVENLPGIKGKKRGASFASLETIWLGQGKETAVFSDRAEERIGLRLPENSSLNREEREGVSFSRCSGKENSGNPPVGEKEGKMRCKKSETSLRARVLLRHIRKGGKKSG